MTPRTTLFLWLLATACHSEQRGAGAPRERKPGPVASLSATPAQPSLCFERLVLGGDVTCLQLVGGALWCRGDPNVLTHGQWPEVPTPPPPFRALPAFDRVKFGSIYGCGLRGRGPLLCWGRNDQRELREEHGFVLAPLEQPRFGAVVDDFSVNTRCVRRADAVTCEDTRLATVVNLPTGIRHLDTGALLGCASSETELRCWGWTEWSKPEPAGSRHTTDHPAGFVRPLQGVLIDKPTHLRIETLTVGAHHGCFIGDDRAAYCFGEALYGEWGTGVVAYGERDNPDLEHDFRAAHEVTALGHSVRELTAIGQTTCALRDDGSVWCWGDNERHLVAKAQRQFPMYSASNARNLGGATEPLPVQRAELGGDNVHLIPGWQHVCVEKRDGSYWCWGDNRVGQLHSPCTGVTSAECLALLNTEEGAENWLPPRKLELPIARCSAH